VLEDYAAELQKLQTGFLAWRLVIKDAIDHGVSLDAIASVLYDLDEAIGAVSTQAILSRVTVFEPPAHREVADDSGEDDEPTEEWPLALYPDGDPNAEDELRYSSAESGQPGLDLEELEELERATARERASTGADVTDE
jgi:hypothetical protein